MYKPRADNLVKPPANKNNNFWSPLSCLVKEQEDKEVEHTSAKHLLSAVTYFQPSKLQNKIAAKWKRKIRNRSGILDTGCTSGAGAQHNTNCFHNTGLLFKKVFMLPDKMRIRATNKMRLKHYLRPKASKMNIVPNLHSMLISIPKMADTDYIAVFNKKEARIYKATTIIVSASKDPILVAPRCQDTGLWKLNLDYEVLGFKYPDQFITGVDEANAIFDLPNTWQSLFYHHALVGFPPKETFLAAVRAGNYATWHGLTTTLIFKHFPTLDKNAEGIHERAAEGSAVDKGISTGNNQGRTGNSKPTSANNQKALQHLRHGVQTVGHHPHRPNRWIPNHITTKLLVHHGGHSSGCKLHLLQINEEMI